MAKRTSKRSKRTSRRRSSRNGWGRRASSALKGKRRSRSKRTSRRNTGYYYGGMSHPESYDSRGRHRPRRNSRRNPEDYWTQQIRAGSAQRFYVHAGGTVRGPYGKVAAMRVAEHYRDLHKGKKPVKVTEVDRDLKEKTVKVVANRRRRSRANQTYYIPVPPIRKNGRRRRRTSRRNQTYYIPIPPIKKNSRRPRRNSRLSKAKRSKLPAGKFVFPKDRAWPIESARAARDAIKYIKMGRVRSASDFMAIRSFIIKHYPAVWKKYGLSASWQRTSAAKHRGMVHRRQHMRLAANRRR